MRFRRRFVAASLLAPLFAILFPFHPCLAAGTVEGRWVLVEQHYGKGRSDLAPHEQPVNLEFVLRAGSLDGRIWAGDSDAKAVRWPALAVEGEPLPARVKTYRSSPHLDSVTVEYTVSPSADDDLVLEIVEEYRLVDDGRALEGSVRVAFVRGGEPRGSYVLHRRFERRP